MLIIPPPRWRVMTVACAVLAAATTPAARQDRGGDAPIHAQAARRLLIRDAMVIYGNAKPPFGPVDLLIEDGLIARVGGAADGPAPDRIIEARGKYVLPGFVNTHMHWHEERAAGIPQPIQYERNLYLASGVTTTRELGGNVDKSKQWRTESAAHRIVAPRMQVYQRFDMSVARGRTNEQIRDAVREARRGGADGLKLLGLDRDVLEVVLDEAHKQKLPTAAHIGVEETTAKDYTELGVGSIEHFYGVGDAAVDGIQNFPPEMNYSDELHRFARAGDLYAQTNAEKLTQVVDAMVAKGVAWTPTFSIYEASRDLIRAKHLPWYRDYLHPSMEEFWKPHPRRHGSYFFGWTNTLEVRWKRNYRIWMDAVRAFGVKGGLITTGDDAGFIYSLYGFGLIREMELHEEAGFHPLEVLKHATADGARLLGLGDRLGRVRQGYIADLLVVNGNPIEDLRVLNPAGTDRLVNGANVHGGGIEWTIRDGIPYHVPTLMNEVREMVSKARAERPRTTAAGR